MKFIGTQLTGGTCVGCHALSRDGKQAWSPRRAGRTTGACLLLDVATQMPLVAFGSTPKSIFESWDTVGARATSASTATPGATDFNLMLFDGMNGTQHRRHHRHRHAGRTRPTTPTGRSTASSITYVKVGTPGTCAAHVVGRDRDGRPRPTA